MGLADTPSAPFMFSRMDTGKSLPSSRLHTLQGKPIDSNALAERVLILNIWATWCGPCKENREAGGVKRKGTGSFPSRFRPDEVEPPMFIMRG